MVSFLILSYVEIAFLIDPLDSQSVLLDVEYVVFPSRSFQADLRITQVSTAG